MVSDLTVNPVDLWLSTKKLTYRGMPNWGNNLDDFLGLNPNQISRPAILRKLKKDIPNIGNINSVRITNENNKLGVEFYESVR